MKRFLAFLLCAVMLLSFAACGRSEEPAPTAAPTAPAALPTDAVQTDAPTDPAEVTEPAPAVTAPENLVIIDNESATFILTRVEESEHLGMQLHVQCINKTDRALIFSWDMVSVCGYMYDPFWAEEVAAGKIANSTIDLDTYALEKMGIISVGEITFTLRIYDSEDWMEAPIVLDVFTIYPTGLNAETVRFPVREETAGQVVVADDENVRFVIEWADDEDSYAYTVYAYMENKTDKNLMFAWDLVSVNGLMVDPFWATVVAAGKNACSAITFYRSDLTENGITDVNEIEFTLTVSDYENWDAVNLLDKTFTYQP